MKHIHVIFFTLVLLGTAPCLSQQYSLPQFYPIADSVAKYPPIGQQLVILCQKKVDQMYVSFVGTKAESKAIIAVVTPKRFTEPESLALSVTFNGYIPSTGKISTWGYIFDRNVDGNIDYLTLVSGAAAFKGDDFPESFPRRNEYFVRHQLEYFVAHCQLIFNHWADDNYDNYIDALVHVDMDSTRDWVDRHIIVHSTKFDRTFDDAWGFYYNTNEEPHLLTFTATKVPFHPLGKPDDAITWKMLDEKSAILQLLNKAVKACALTSDKFIHPESGNK